MERPLWHHLLEVRRIMKKCKDVIIIGAGGHARVIADIIKINGDNVYGFLDDDLTKDGVIGRVSDCTKYKEHLFIIGIGNNVVRKKIFESYPECSYYTAIHPSAIIAEDVEIGCGTVVMANAVINSSSKVGNHCIVNTSAVVEHDNNICDYAHVSPGAILCGTVEIGECTHIGAGAVVKNNVVVGRDITVGVGAAVVKNINKSGIYVGVPVNKI